jgi:hypothetical protein
MSLDLSPSVPDLFAKTQTGQVFRPTLPITPASAPVIQQTQALAFPLRSAGIITPDAVLSRLQLPTGTTEQQKLDLKAVLSEILKNDPGVQKAMTAAEKAAVEQVIKNVGTPDEYDSAAEYVIRALPYVRGVYSAMDVVQPGMPNDTEISILMKDRFLQPDKPEDF